MKKLIIFTFALALIATSFDASAKVRKKHLLGDWKYEVPTAPYGYDTGTFKFFETEGELDGELILSGGAKVDLSDVKLEKDMVSFSLYVEGGYVNVKAKIDGKTMSGSVATMEGDMKMTATKEE